MGNPDNRIIEFILQHHVLTLSVASESVPYCATCFYSYLTEENLFVFTSDENTRHIRDFQSCGHDQVAAAIHLETKITGKIRGIQVTGKLKLLTGEDLKKARKKYRHDFPVARLTTLHLWGLIPDYIKLTDNRLGFGKKIIWHRFL